MNIRSVLQLKPDEQILQIVRESSLAHGWSFFFAGLLFLSPFFLLFPLFQMGTLGLALFGALFVVALVVIVRVYRTWAYTMLVITDLRLVDVDQNGLFDRVVTELMYPEIEDVSYRTKGIWATIFRLGKIHLHTKGNAADLEFHFVKYPDQVHDLINDLRAEHV